MKLYLDDVNFDTIKKVADIYPIDGITSNPSVLKKSGKAPVEQLRAVREFIGQDKMLMSQVVSTTAEDMIKEARVLKEIIADDKEEKYFVKLPANEQGIKAIRQLAAEGMRCNATAIYDVTQGYVALEAGAKALAPYVNRIDNLGGDGLDVTRDLQNIIDVNGYDAVIVPGSIKSVRQILECARIPVYGVAVAGDVFDGMLDNIVVDNAVDKFNSDFADLVGEGKTYLDLV